MKKLLLATVAAFGLAGLAEAGSIVVPAPVPMPMVAAPAAYDWSGPYVGAYAGMGWGDIDYTPGPAHVVDPAFAYGGFAGYNFQNGALVYGVEVAAGMYDGFPVGFPVESYDYFVDGKLRVGYAMDNVLAYGFGGGSLGHYALNAGNDWMVYGVNFGAGVEVGMGDNVVVGAEYIGRYLSGATTLANTQDSWINAVQARVSWRF